MWVDQMVDQFSTYIYQKRGFFYFSKRIPKQVQHCHGKQRIVFSLNTKSRAKAVKYAQVICQRLDERWPLMRLNAMGLGNVLANDVTSSNAPKLSEVLQDYLQLKGMGKPKTFIKQQCEVQVWLLRYVAIRPVLITGPLTEVWCVTL